MIEEQFNDALHVLKKHPVFGRFIFFFLFLEKRIARRE